MPNWWESSDDAQRSFAPEIVVNMEFGVSFSGHERPHSLSMNYVSRNMRERMYRQQWEGETYQFARRNPTILMPGEDFQSHSRTRDQQHGRQRRLRVSEREQHERGSSAPPTIADRNEPVSPLSPSPLNHTPRFSRTPDLDRPLPPNPSSFRLGEDNLPWSVPPWYQPPEPEFSSPTLPRESPSRGRDMEGRRTEDPRRVRELDDLQQAMMTVDSLGHEGSEIWIWGNGVSETNGGRRSLGWAVRSSERSPSITSSPPPPYVVSQYETLRRADRRPRSSG